MIHTCPRCELRFTTEAELADHMEIDHHTDPTEFERFRYKPKPTRPPSKRYLVLANQTLEDDRLLDRIRSLSEGGAHFHVVAPATPSEPGVPTTDDKGLALATYRLRHIIDKLHAEEIDAEGEVGPSDPLRAAARALEHEPADEILISTLPRGASRWLDVDLPAALERRFAVPVTVLTAST